MIEGFISIFSSLLIITFFAIIAYIVIMFIISLFNKGKREREKTISKYNNVTDISHNEIERYLPNYNKDELKNIAFNKFNEVLEAYSNEDKKTIKNLCSEDQYKRFINKLEELKNVNKKNIIENIKLIGTKITDIRKEENKIIASFYIVAETKSYLIDEKEKKEKKTTNEFTVDIYKTGTNQQEDSNNCPNCGSPLNSNGLDTCTYCNTKINKYDFKVHNIFLRK